jgi:hypothetical protein
MAVQKKYYSDRRCLCGCGGRIEIRDWHDKSGIPKFLRGHHVGLGEANPAKRLEIREKMRKSQQKLYAFGQENPMLGKHHSEETIQKIRNTIKLNGGRKGENNGNWKGGNSLEDYPIEFFRIRNQIKERDDYQCQNCNKLENAELEEIGKGLSVHHIDYDKQNCDPENLITLCNICNSKVNANRSYWKKFFQLKRQQLREGDFSNVC